jgi:iron complex transport system ATP-binding protein
LGIATVRDKPFAPITAEKAAQNTALIDKAEAVVVSPVYWGPGNLKNLEMVGKSAQKGKEIILVEDGKKRDFTPGKKAGQLVQKLIKSESVAVVKSEAKVAAILEEKLYKKTT